MFLLRAIRLIRILDAHLAPREDLYLALGGNVGE
jgi:hypothetical protein